MVGDPAPHLGAVIFISPRRLDWRAKFGHWYADFKKRHLHAWMSMAVASAVVYFVASHAF